jgi:hypothetical protein
MYSDTSPESSKSDSGIQNMGGRGENYAIAICYIRGKKYQQSIKFCLSLVPVVDCGDPPTLDNGRLTVSPPASIILGSVVTYECNDGFVLDWRRIGEPPSNTRQW